MPSPPQRRWFSELTLAVLPVLYAVAITSAAVARGPFYLAFQNDPEYQYLFFGLELAEFYIPSNFQHPGTPVVMLMSVLVTVCWLVSGVFTGFTSKGVFVAEHHTFLLYLGSAVVAGGIALLLYVIGRQIYKLTGSILPGIALQVVPFASWSLFIHTQRVAPEGFEPLLMLLMLWTLAPATFGNASTAASFPPWRAFLAGVLAVACPAAKYIFLAPIGLLILVPRWRNMLWAVGGFAAGYAVMLSVPSYLLATQRKDFVRIMANEVPPSYFDQLAVLVRADWAVAGLALTGGLVLVLSAWWALGSKRNELLRIWLVTGVGLLALIAQAVAVGSRFRPHYYVAAITMCLFLAPHLAELIRRAIPWRVPATVIAGALILLMPLAPQATMRILDDFRVSGPETIRRHQEARAIVERKQATEGCRVVAFYSSSYPLFALSFGNDFSKRRFADDLQSVYPDFRIYDQFISGFRDWHHNRHNLEYEQFVRDGGCVVLQVGRHEQHHVAGWQVHSLLEPEEGERLHQGAYELSLDARNPVLYTPVIRSNQSIRADEFQSGNVSVVESGDDKMITSDALPAFAEYRVEREGKRHGVRIRYAANDSLPVSVRINGELVFDAACFLPTGGEDADFLRWHDIGIHQLVEGENVVRLESNGPFPLIAEINLRPVKD